MFYQGGISRCLGHQGTEERMMVEGERHVMIPANCGGKCTVSFCVTVSSKQEKSTFMTRSSFKKDFYLMQI